MTFSTQLLSKIFKPINYLKIDDHKTDYQLNQLDHIKLDQLPIEILVMIFELLNMNDLLNCRLMNKKFKNIVSMIKVNELIFNENSAMMHNDCSIGLKKLINNVINLRKEKNLTKFLNSSIINLKSIKYLKIGFQLNDIELINQFTNLKYLELNVKFKSNSTNLLKLKYLEYLYCDNIIVAVLKRKNRTNFEMIESDSIELKYKDQLKHLQTKYLNDDIFKFTNLETLSVDSIDCLNETIIDKLPKLNKLSFRAENKLGPLFKTTKNTIIKLLNQNKLEIYFKGELINNKTDLDNYVDQSFVNWFNNFICNH